MKIEKKEIRLKARNIWRKNQKLIVLVGMAAILGILIAGINTWHYDNTKKKFALDSSQEINNREGAEFSFRLNEPQLVAKTTLKIRIDNMDTNTVLSLKVNGREIQEITSETATVDIPKNSLQPENTVTITKKNLGFQGQELVEAQVISFTNLQQIMFILLNFFSLLLIFVPVGYLKYNEFTKQKEMEERFPDFVRDVLEGTRAGMSLPHAIQNSATGDYGALDPHVEKMAAQLEWGIPFDKVLDNFSNSTESDTIRRSTDTIVTAYRSGGNIEDVLESVGENIRSIKKLKEERQNQLYGEMITGYLVYFIFIGILIALTTYLLPNLADASSSLGGGLNILGSGGGTSLQENIALYKTWFARLVYIQAISSGLIIGKLSEGALKAGIKHSTILFAAGYLAVTIFM